MAKINTRVHSAEYAFTVILGWPIDGQGPGYQALNDFEFALGVLVGGYFKTYGDGFWDGQHEHSKAYYFTADNKEDALSQLDALLTQYGDGLRNRWVHIDTKVVSTHHREVVPSDSTLEMLAQHAGQWPEYNRPRDEVSAEDYNRPPRMTAEEAPKERYMVRGYGELDETATGPFGLFSVAREIRRRLKVYGPAGLVVTRTIDEMMQ